MKKIFIITTFIIVLLVCFLGVTYSYEYNENDSLKFYLIGPSTLYVDVNTDYEEYGIEVIYNGMNISSSVNIDSSSVDTSTLGEYRLDMN